MEVPGEIHGESIFMALLGAEAVKLHLLLPNEKRIKRENVLIFARLRPSHHAAAPTDGHRFN
jgi:hypothetical protein